MLGANQYVSIIRTITYFTVVKNIEKEWNMSFFIVKQNINDFQLCLGTWKIELYGCLHLSTVLWSINLS